MNRAAYTPYKSDSDSDSDSESDESLSSQDTDSTDSAGSTSQEEGLVDYADFSKLATGLAAMPAYTDVSGAGPPPILQVQPSNFSYNLYNPITSGGYATFSNLVVPTDPSGSLLKAAPTSVTSIITVDSRNRDRNVYPQPTNATLRLPRVYKNVANFQVVQMKFLSAFYYFRGTKHNIEISILEQGRQILNGAGQLIDNIITNQIREGTYDINTLLQEIQTQLNKTPLFYDYINGFADFAVKFASTGDFSLNFNQPGDTYYDSLLDTFIPNPTMDFIVSKYFLNRYAGLSSYTASQIKIAYYYPVLKEVLLDQNFPDAALLNLTLSPASQAALLPGETARSRVIYTFQGINDPVVLELITNNLTILDEYRLQHTFRYYLINKYNVYYESFSNHVVFSSPSLNTSLVTLLNQKQAEFFAEQLNKYGLTQAQYDALVTQNALTLAVLNGMSQYYQKQLAIYFGIPFDTFDLKYLTAPTLTLPIRDAFNAVGISSNYDAAVLLDPNDPIQTDILGRYKQSAPTYWNRIKDLSNTTLAFMNPVLSSEGPTNTLPLATWSQDMDAQDFANPLVASNVLDPNNPNTGEIGLLYANKRTGISDTMVPLESTMYTVFRFKSPVRQTLLVETLPRPTKYRYPAYNSTTVTNASTLALFDASYCFISTSVNGLLDVSSADFTTSQLQFLPGFSTPSTTANFGIDQSTSLGLWGGASNTLSILTSRTFYQFYTPIPPGAPAAPAYRYPLAITLSNATPGQPFPSPLQAFLYHDRAAFMADISSNRLENPVHYLQTVSTTSSMSTVDLTFQVYANQAYYILARSQSTSFAATSLRVAPWFPASNAYSTLTDSLTGFNPLADPTLNLDNFNAAKEADPAWIRLPIQSSLWTTTPEQGLATSSLTFSTPLMGYDASGASTDLTNYCGFVPNESASNVVPNAQIRIDPATGYLFQAKSPYNLSTQTYFYAGSSNAILTSNAAGLYTPGTVAARQQSIVHWYGTTFVPPSENQLLFDPADIAVAAVPPFTATYPGPAALNGYTYVDRLDISGNPYLGQSQFIDFGDGIMGIGFVPDRGKWDIDRFSFKSIFLTSDPARDPNRSIQFLGIFPAAQTSNRDLNSLTLASAVAVLQFAQATTYNSSNLNFGYDVNGGTFYEFTRISGSSALYGWAQSAYEYNFDLNAYYVAVPFTAASTMTYFYGLVGSPIPYPLYNYLNTVNSAPSPIGPLAPPTGADFFLPDAAPLPGANALYGPPAGATRSQSKYEQSMPIGTNLLVYANPYPINTISTAFDAWSPFPYVPTEVITDCSGYILLKDSQFRVFSYQNNTSTQTFTESYQFTLDQVFPPASNIDFLGCAANESNFAFFGLSNAAPSSILYIRTMNPQTGAILDTRSEVSPAGFQSSVQLFQARYNNVGGYVMACQSWDAGSATTDIQVVSKAASNSPSLTTFRRQTSQPTISYFQVGQSPKEQYGRFWVFPQRTGLTGPGPLTDGIQDFAFVNPNDSNLAAPAGDYEASFNDGVTTLWATVTQYYLSTNAPYTFRSPVVTRDVAKDRVFFLCESSPSTFFEAPIITGISTPQVVESAYQFPSTPTTFYAGAAGAKWALIYDTLYGNRADYVDGPKRGSQAWQIFYPVHRIAFRQLARNFTLMSNLDGLEYGEWPHTAITVYDSSGGITADTSARWGQEVSTNFVSADFQFSGTYFNSYQFAVPLVDNRSSADFYYLSLRNYTPTEKSQVNLRVSLPNKYTFGYVTPLDLSGEISTAAVVSTTQNPLQTYFWDSRYIDTALAFDKPFIIDSNGIVFGSNVIAGYPGSTLSNITGFGDFYGRFVNLYSTYAAQAQLVSTINTAVASNMSNFILTEMSNIIPPSALNRQRFTDPLRYSILWKSALLPNYAKLEEEWGLGWNLGFDKVDTPFETVQKARSFFKIIDDYIYLRLNPEYDMNRVDTVGNEDLAITTDSTGATKAYYGKLLLANFGNYAQTMISNPLSFSPPFGKVDKISFQWVDTTGAIIDNSDCEWNAVIQIVESVELVQPTPLPILQPR